MKARPAVGGEFIAHSMLAAKRGCRDGCYSMTLLTFFGFLPALFGMAATGPSEQPAVRRVIIHEEVIIRIPVRPRPAQRIEWAERKGPKCLQSNHIAGAMLSGPSSIDFVLRNRQRVRAIMDSECPALDFYGRIYLQPEDDRICAKREEIRSRVGGSCRIERFRLLVPQLKQVRR